MRKIANAHGAVDLLGGRIIERLCLRTYDWMARMARMSRAAAGTDLLVGGPNLAAQALVAGLVDELALFVWPVVLGGRNPALPTDTRADLELIDEHRFSSGVVHLRYRLQ
jgi:riboflavin biosynthesis pyrimidine reductase